MANCCRLFTIPPGLIFEHPPTLPVVSDQVPAGPIAGWECYAVGFFAEARTVFGPFDPVIVERPGGRCIAVHRDPGGPDLYWFLGIKDGVDPAPGPALRFVAKRGETAP